MIKIGYFIITPVPDDEMDTGGIRGSFDSR